VDVYEIKLGEAFLMSSLFTDSEIALAEHGLAAAHRPDCDVLVGGLGLGYTARAVLEHDSVATLTVVEYLAPVIDWHRDGLVPMGTALDTDPRCQLVQGDFFALAQSREGFDPDMPGRQFDSILVDIDHSPDALLNDRNESFYRPEGLRAAAQHLKPGGVFGLWSNDAPDARFLDRLGMAFAEAWAEPVTFHNPLMDQPYTQTVYLARRATT